MCKLRCFSTGFYEEVYNQVPDSFYKCTWGRIMCELTVILDGNVVFKDAVYAKVESGNVVVKDILGESKEFKNCKIVEVDVNSTNLILSSV
jgi:predicted RNA-binding protein